MNARRLAINAGCVLATLFIVARAEDPDHPCGVPDERFSEEAEELWNTKRDAITQEIVTLGDHSWAGSYAFEGASLWLAPENGGAFRRDGRMDQNVADIVQSQRGFLTLEFKYHNDPNCYGYAEKLVPVTWGERCYIIPLDDMRGFCNAVNFGSEPRPDMHTSSYLLRVGDHKKPAVGIPNIPKEFRGYLLQDPIHAEIVAIESTTSQDGCQIDTHETTIVLNVGTASKVLPGMSFGVLEPSLIPFQARVTSVGERSSKAVYKYMTWPGQDFPLPQVGWKMTTRSPWRRDAEPRKDR